MDRIRQTFKDAKQILGEFVEHRSGGKMNRGSIKLVKNAVFFFKPNENAQ